MKRKTFVLLNSSWYNRHVTRDSVSHVCIAMHLKRKVLLWSWVVVCLGGWLGLFCIAAGMGGYHFDWYGVCLGSHYISQLGLKFTMMLKLLSNSLWSQLSSLSTRIIGVYQHAWFKDGIFSKLQDVDRETSILEFFIIKGTRYLEIF